MSWFHQHRWTVTGSHMMMRGPFGIDPSRATPITEVLLVCSCGKVKTLTLDGHWTLEQLQPAPGTAEADREFFRKLGVKL
jgi:hypothetical protein